MKKQKFKLVLTCNMSDKYTETVNKKNSTLSLH